MRHLIKTRESILDAIRKRPYLFYRVMPLKRRYHELLINDRTELVIEGYPRCANTFAVAALEVTQDKELRLARHTHAIAQIKTAYTRSIPTLILIRNPTDAILSYVIREDNITLEMAIKRYIDFNSTVLSLADRFVVSDFDTTINHFHNVLEELNKKFGLNLTCRQLDRQDRDQIRLIVENMEKMFAGGTLSEFKVSRPSDTRQKLKKQLKESLLSKRDPNLEIAHCIYERLKRISIKT